MIDLIRRSELLKRFLVNKDGHRMPEKDCDNFEITVPIKDIKRIIREQPTAYDIDKTIKELEELRKVDMCESGDCPYEDTLCRDCTQYRMLDKAIEIVKQSGV